MVDLKIANKSLEVDEKSREDEEGAEEFKDLSKTSAKSSYPEVITEPSHQVTRLNLQILNNFQFHLGDPWRYGLEG